MTRNCTLVIASSRSPTILVHEWVTGGGMAGRPLPASWADEGRAMRRAIAADFTALRDGRARVVVTIDSRLPEEPGPWVVEKLRDDEAPQRLVDLASRADFTVLIAPETTGILARLTARLQKAGARVFGSSLEAVSLTGDKSRLARWLADRGIPTPPSRVIVPRDGLPVDTRYPAVLKPVDGAGTLDTFFIEGPDSLPADAMELPAALLQPFVPGRPMSASFLVDREGRAWLVAIGLQDATVQGGRFSYRGGRLPAPAPAAEPLLRAAAESIPGLHGFVGVDFLWNADDRHATILEINPRPTTSVVGLTRLLPPGHLAEAWIEAFEPESAGAARLPGLAGWIHAQAPVSFDTLGVILDVGVKR